MIYGEEKASGFHGKKFLCLKSKQTNLNRDELKLYPTATLSSDGKLLAVHVPMTFRKRGGRKMVVAQDGSTSAPHSHAWPARRSNVDQSLLTTLHPFSGTQEGANPYAGLLQGSDGAYYGST